MYIILYKFPYDNMYRFRDSKVQEPKRLAMQEHFKIFKNY